MDKKQEIEEIIKIYEIYPPLTSNKISQLAFLKTCLLMKLGAPQTSVKTYIRESFRSHRNLKYSQQLDIIKSNKNFQTPSYFKA